MSDKFLIRHYRILGAPVLGSNMIQQQNNKDNIGS